MLKSLSIFLMEAGVNSKVHTENAVIIQKLEAGGLKILITSDSKYYWCINDRVVLCRLSNVPFNNTLLNNLICTLGKKYAKKYNIYNALHPFINDEGPSDDMIDSLLFEKVRFNHSIISTLGDESVLNFFKEVTDDISNIIKLHDDNSIGLSFFKVPCIVKIFRHIIHRYYRMITYYLEQIYVTETQKKKVIDINHMMTCIARTENINTCCLKLIDNFKLLEGSKKLTILSTTLLTFLLNVYEKQNDTFDEFRKDILMMVYYKGIDTKRSGELLKRPKVRKRVKLSWREKRPSRIITDIAFEAPLIAERIKRLDSKCVFDDKKI